jgi:hypothetical protein
VGPQEVAFRGIVGAKRLGKRNRNSAPLGILGVHWVGPAGPPLRDAKALTRSAFPEACLRNDRVGRLDDLQGGESTLLTERRGNFPVIRVPIIFTSGAPILLGLGTFVAAEAVGENVDDVRLALRDAVAEPKLAGDFAA